MRMALAIRHLKSSGHQRFIGMRTHRPAPPPTGVPIHECRHIQPPFLRVHHGDISDPALVGSGGAKLAIEQIRGDGMIMGTIRGARLALASGCRQSELVYETGNPLPMQCGMDPWAARDRTLLGESRFADAG